MTKEEIAIYEREADLQNAFLKGFLASNISFNGEMFIYDRRAVMGNTRYQKLVDKFIKEASDNS